MSSVMRRVIVRTAAPCFTRAETNPLMVQASEDTIISALWEYGSAVRNALAKLSQGKGRIIDFSNMLDRVCESMRSSDVSEELRVAIADMRDIVEETAAAVRDYLDGQIDEEALNAVDPNLKKEIALARAKYSEA